ncbi:MAG: hypothetical protein KC431_06360, partial [Myxococcales bacterium]|nr:hypothetical protein [Myxococcales bacterium]
VEGPLPLDCEGLAASFDLNHLLMRCGRDWALLDNGPRSRPNTRIPLLSAADEEPLPHVYGRSGLALGGPGPALALFDPAGLPRATLPGLELLPTLLDAEIDRALARGPEGLAILDLAKAEVLVRVPETALDLTPTLRAFAPDGSALALADGAELAIIDLRDGHVRARWSAPQPVKAMAWRQDAGALWTGHTRERPELAWDPHSGAAAPFDPLLALRLEQDPFLELDPSWRWAFFDVDDSYYHGGYIEKDIYDFDHSYVSEEDGLLRLIDGQTLFFVGDEVVLESGLWDGASPVGLAVRVIMPGRMEVTALDALPARLQHPGLLADFLAGAPLPAPRLRSDELAARTTHATVE